jgi:excisionase family DNA binding protein
MAEDVQSFKVAEVAQRLRVDPRTIYRVIALGHLRAVRVGRVWRVPADALEAYLEGDAEHVHPDAGAGG